MPFVTSRDGTQIGYSVVGSGPPIVLVDGAMCWREMGPATALATELKGEFTVYTYDRRGRGESGDTRPYATTREVEDLEAIIDAAGGSVAIYAISSGVLVALETANAIPGKITGLVLYEAPIFTDSTRKPVPTDYVQVMDQLVASGDNAGAVKYFMQKGIDVPWYALLMMQLFGMFRKMAPVGPTLPYDTAFVAPLWTYRPIPPGRWRNATMPVLAIGGAKSDEWMQNAQKAIAANLPNAQHQTLPGQNHMVAAPAIAPMIREFLL
ncbi:MAG: alpha/beta hydrolase [Hyphomicrobiales bacterium]|nr:MAG: alpha/beta hydrolase [Hyphomicrobiales bacterium]